MVAEKLGTKTNKQDADLVAVFVIILDHSRWKWAKYYFQNEYSYITKELLMSTNNINIILVKSNGALKCQEIFDIWFEQQLSSTYCLKRIKCLTCV